MVGLSTLETGTILKAAKGCPELLRGRTSGGWRFSAQDARDRPAVRSSRETRCVGETSGEPGLDEAPLPHRTDQPGERSGGRPPRPQGDTESEDGDAKACNGYRSRSHDAFKTQARP